MKQFVLPFAPGGSGPEKHRLTGRDYRYLVKVRRHRRGDRLSAMAPDGTPYRMEFLSVTRDSCEILVEPADVPDLAASAESPAMSRLTLMPAITKGKKMDIAVRQAVEAGAAEFWPLLTDFGQVRYADEDGGNAKRARWDRIAKEALQQCGGREPMNIVIPRTLEEAVDAWHLKGPLFFFHEKWLADGGLHGHLAEPVSDIGIMVGPEGGLSPEETGFLLKEGAIPIQLGPRVLRAETAALYAVAAISTIIRENDEWQPA